MNKQNILNEAARFVKQMLGNDASGHDWRHIERVARTAHMLARKEGADEFICQLAALLHDVADEKLRSSEEEGLAEVSAWLCAHGVEESVREHVVQIIATMSYKGGHNKPVTTVEAQVVQDADRLDAIGAIGVARTFAYAGAKGHLMYDPDSPFRQHMSHEEYRSGRSTAVNHFYEKLLKLRDLMNTETGRRIANRRHRFMERFLDQFYLEWDGRDMD
ncbi:HD domain-containing protein [Paenibacillus xerothermodurans]|uniref:HD domain-containing protein n=1 Tax=Paenibacillus xerothermodurans TaxID=1977292 RepID=A0A2W1N415_PAEXE|nr:HD domain-containing protein [Paenibacillus xerothermodurans]PZE19499.1 HD domain-containing protein [Paenibacillus xerothermodurans]